MRGRRTAAMLCVLALHAFLGWGFIISLKPEGRRVRAPVADSAPAMQFVFVDPEDSAAPVQEEPPVRSAISAPRAPEMPAARESEAISPVPKARPFVDWPVEARESAERVLAAEREAERLAKMFAGPDGTWASLTKRQRSQLNKFKWAPGVDGLEYDDQGNAIYTLPTGCTIVNFMFFGCPLGKPKVNDDMFDNMRLYFDEQRLPEIKDGNGTEPEALRPAR